MSGLSSASSASAGGEPRNRRVVAVIPARGGSKGVPRKNLARLGGQTLLGRAIACGLACPEVARVIVSTDDEEMRDHALACGAEAPFLRPAELARDDTPDRPVFVHLIEWLRDNEGYAFDWLVNLRCTTPLKRPSHVAEALRLMAQGGCDAVRTADRIAGKHHPYWMWRLDEAGLARRFMEGIDPAAASRRQLLPPVHAVNGLVDVMSVPVVLAGPGLYGTAMRLLETDPLYSCDIDDPRDLVICEAIMEKLAVLEGQAGGTPAR